MAFYHRGAGVIGSNSNLTPRLRCATASLVLLVIAGWTGRAGAQTEPAPDTTASSSGAHLEEIVVSARRRSESLQNVPVAVAPITKEQIENNDASSFSNLAELAPQVMIGSTAVGTGALLGIRGISSGANDAGIDQSVSVDIDGIQLSRGRIINNALFDLEQVEVLEGPQALFFGKNSPAGVISLHTADPTNQFEASVKTGYEFKASEKFGEGVVSGPLTDTLKARLAVRVSYMGGWIQNVATPTEDPFAAGIVAPGPRSQITSPIQNDLAARLTLLWNPADDFDAKFKLTVDQQHYNGQLDNAEPYCTGGQTIPMELGIPGNPVNCNKDMVKAVNAMSPVYAANLAYGNDGDPYGISQVLLGSLTLNKKFNGLTLTSTTGFYIQNVTDSGVDDESELALIYDAEHEHYKLITQELRANSELDSPVNFTGGLYFEHSNRPYFNTPILFPPLEGFDPVANNYSNSQMQSVETGDVYSVFAQARWDITSTVELAAGARYTYDQSDLTVQNLTVNPGSAGLGIDLYPAGQVIDSHYVDHNVSPEATLTWHPEPGQTVYAGYKTGYKPGGISNGSLLYSYADAQNLQFGHETVKGGEIGYKADLFNQTLRVDVTVYDYNYDGLQVSSVNNTNGATVDTVSNAAKATTRGLEGAIKWLATDALSFSGNVGYNRARYASFPAGHATKARPPRKAVSTTRL